MSDKIKTDNRMWLFKSYADEDDVRAVSDVIRRGTWWANGPEIEAFEAAVADVTDREYAVAFNSGTTALYAQLVATGVTDGEVIVPSFTFPATANAVIAAGAKPVFADIERESLALAASAVSEAVTDDTVAIMPIHFAGNVAKEIHDLQGVADEADAVLLEDACHSLGASMDGTPAGSFGIAASFSFCFNKIISTGEGGMVVTDSAEVRDRLHQIRSHGRNPDGTAVTWGYNFRMSSMTAALGGAQMDKFDDIVAERHRMAAYLNNRLRDLSVIKTPEPPADHDRVYLYYNLRLEDEQTQAALANFLEERGIPSRVTYKPTHLTPYYREEWGWEQGDLPMTEEVAGRVLTLPFHMDLSDEDLAIVADTVRSFFE